MTDNIQKSTQYKILAADDDPQICKVIKQILSSSGMYVKTTQDGSQVLKLAKEENYDLIMLDIMFEKGSPDGYSIIESLRSNLIQVPVFLISALAEESSKVYGFSVGADDYITKPFSAIELLYRVKAILRRTYETNQSGKIEKFPFTYLQNEMKLFKTDKNGRKNEIVLTTKESQMMLFFLTHINWVITTEQLYMAVWSNRIIDNNTIMVHISKLRNKIEDNPKNPLYIKTIRGIGYQFCLPEA